MLTTLTAKKDMMFTGILNVFNNDLFETKERFEYNEKVWNASIGCVKGLFDQAGKYYPIEVFDIERYKEEYVNGGNGHCLWFKEEGTYISILKISKVEMYGALKSDLIHLMTMNTKKYGLKFFILQVYNHLKEQPKYWTIP